MRRRLVFVISLAIAIGCFWQMSQSGRQKETKGSEDRRQNHMEQYVLAGRLKVPTPEDVSENPYIYRYNHELCREKGLTEDGNGLGSRYLCMQAVYRANLDAYLMEMLNLRKLDDELKESGLGFTAAKPKDQNLYERESTMGLRYICLRNNLYIENLETGQLNILEHQLRTGKEAVTDEIQEMVKRTYQEVLRVRDPEDWEGQGRFLYAGSQGRKPEIPNQALVLEISNAMEYDASGGLFSGDRMREKCEYLDKIKAEKEKEYSGILGMEVYILLE